MAQAQLNDPPLHQETSFSDQTSISDQTSHLDITRPPDPPDPSLSLSLEGKTLNSLLSLYHQPEQQVASIMTPQCNFFIVKFRIF